MATKSLQQVSEQRRRLVQPSNRSKSTWAWSDRPLGRLRPSRPASRPTMQRMAWRLRQPTSDAESDAGPTAAELLEMAQSKAGCTAIICAYRVVALRRQQLFPDSWPTFQLDMAQVKYRHALRRVNEEYPGLLPSRRAGHEFSATSMVRWTVALEAAGHSNPAAVVAARKVGFDLASAAEECQRCGGDSIWPVECTHV